jgi:hypothetical protein
MLSVLANATKISARLAVQTTSRLPPTSVNTGPPSGALFSS